MLELLAGPFPLSLNGVAGVGVRFSTPQWHDALGLVGGAVDEDSRQYSAIWQIDGVGFSRNNRRYHGSLQHNLKTGGLCNLRGGSNFYESFDMRMLVALGEAVAVSQPWTVLPDRYIRGYNSKILWLDGVDIEEEAVLEVGAPARGEAIVSPGREAAKLFVAFGDGTIFEYDWKAKVVSGRVRRLPESDFPAFYSPLLGVFILLEEGEAGQTLSVYADETAPTTIIGPDTLVEATTGGVGIYRVLVTGAEGDPCEGVAVDWAVSGATLLEPQSITDAAGEARARVRISTTPPGATFELTAEVLT